MSNSFSPSPRLALSSAPRRANIANKSLPYPNSIGGDIIKDENAQQLKNANLTSFLVWVQMGTITNFSARNPDDYVATFHEMICTLLDTFGYNN